VSTSIDSYYEGLKLEFLWKYDDSDETKDCSDLSLVEECNNICFYSYASKDLCGAVALEGEYEDSWLF